METPAAEPEVLLSPTPGISTQNVAILSFIVALVGLAIFILLNKRKSTLVGNALLLTGPPDAGKTAILSTLVYDQTLPTHTSLQVNESVVCVSAPNTMVQAVDVPGHPRVRDQFREYLPKSKAIVFVVDAGTISRNGPAVAEHLHAILHALTSLPPSHTPPSLAIAAHKSDLLKASASSTPEALAISRVKTILERELEKRRASQSGGVGVEGLGAEGEATDMGGLECTGNAGEPFKFEAWEGGEVTFIGTSCKVTKRNEVAEKGDDSEDGLVSLRNWLDETF
ncbi:hypothetical protein HGRIS_012897 [Hohenbuehelia grisea]|uniref:Signal recognition particle receptor subunit beta n=1 Tax=Hohenbuehelia grisea TaxID=104357 RepID=A0ABR3IU20_9AGAR